jgi:hypothetical protein
LNPNPVGEFEIRINELRLKYRTYLVEFDVQYVSNISEPLYFRVSVCYDYYFLIFCVYYVLQGVVSLLTMFAHDFDDQIDKHATLVDANNNEFEVLVQRNNHVIFLRKGWHRCVIFITYHLVTG